jgi:hypothetical protein
MRASPSLPSPTLRSALALAFALALAAALPAGALERRGEPWLHLTVEEAPPGDATVHVNLPLALVEGVLALVPEAEVREARIAFDDADVSLAELAAAWRRLGRRSGTLLTVDEPRHRTVVARRGGFLVVDSHDRRRGDERVVVRISAPVVDALLAGPGDRLDLAGAVRALAATGAGEITADSDDGDRVRIWVDRAPEPAARPRSRR